LKHNPWEGNARELENVIERALALSDNAEIGPADLPLADAEGPDTLDAPSLAQGALERRFTLAQLEDLYVNQVLEHTRGNKVQAARILGINRRTLYRRGDRRGEHNGSDRGDEDLSESDATTGRSR